MAPLRGQNNVQGASDAGLIPQVLPDYQSVADQEVRTLRPDQTAYDAAQLMTAHNISAVIVVDDNDRLAGIVTERDLSRRVVAQDRKGSELKLGEIMTEDPAALRPEDNAAHAMETMRNLKIRHLPVVKDDKVVGIVSIRDLRHSLSRAIVTV